MKKIFIIAAIFLFFSGLTASEIVVIDNSEIQEYRGITGKWTLIESNKSLPSTLQKYGAMPEDFFRINSITNERVAYDYYFIPCSQDYLNKLKVKGIERISIQSELNHFIWPVNDVEKITSVIGYRNRRFHPGLDVPAMNGQPVIASMEGVVKYSGYASGYGRMVVLQHRDDFSTKYAHNSANFVKKGEFVKKGQIIGLVGSTGNSTGNHIHFEIRCRDIPLDPLDFLPDLDNLYITHTLKNWK